MEHEGYMTRAARHTEESPWLRTGKEISIPMTRAVDHDKAVADAKLALKRAKAARSAAGNLMLEEAGRRAEAKRLRNLAITALEEIAHDAECAFTGEARSDAAKQLLNLTD